MGAALTSLAAVDIAANRQPTGFISCEISLPKVHAKWRYVCVCVSSVAATVEMIMFEWMSFASASVQSGCFNAVTSSLDSRNHSYAAALTLCEEGAFRYLDFGSAFSFRLKHRSRLPLSARRATKKIIISCSNENIDCGLDGIKRRKKRE